jgi:hypothetical protein
MFGYCLLVTLFILAILGMAQLAALVNQPEYLYIQRHREHHQIGRQHGAVVVAGLGMHLKYLNPLQLGQGGGGLVQPVEVVADRTHAAHEHQAQGLIAEIANTLVGSF